ncbi:MAG: hypothetical protein PWP44_1761 [Thermacetogenium sp.]|uniref:Integrase catalytic region n=1 Tax=Thermacetogenium phaeum TaxID=85874 RepID=A0A101FFE5_9THEO|nr:MAG: Integrase catalytic region [Thermacetogenium phaeum]MDN5366555.1 hypothetical protein [Thermacetogenium sp.]
MAEEFLDELIKRSPFEIKAIQVDGGSEFYADFESACKEYRIKLFCSPPRSPKLNRIVERLNRTYREEFWECYEGEANLGEVRRELKRWTIEVYNQVRPHQNLGVYEPRPILATVYILLVLHMYRTSTPSCPARYSLLY